MQGIKYSLVLSINPVIHRDLKMYAPWIREGLCINIPSNMLSQNELFALNAPWKGD